VTKSSFCCKEPVKDLETSVEDLFTKWKLSKKLSNCLSPWDGWCSGSYEPSCCQMSHGKSTLKQNGNAGISCYDTGVTKCDLCGRPCKGHRGLQAHLCACMKWGPDRITASPSKSVGSRKGTDCVHRSSGGVTASPSVNGE